ncbi:MAG: hypothetical protein KBI44_11375 [Thermoanaerobaculia bacterium]|nr:hypothetical protein [Thermoanaerobaculia bacterium]
MSRILSTVGGIFLASCTVLRASSPPPPVTIKGCPAARTLLATLVEVQWGVPASGPIEFRYKLDVPGDWMGGLAYAMNKWSDWESTQSVSYRNFVVEGAYRFTVQSRWSGSTESAEATCSWQIYWEYPEIREAAMTIDWNRVNAAPDKRERYRLLAEEYGRQSEMALREFDYEVRMLKLTTSPRELVDTVAGAVTEQGNGMLLEWADRSTAAVAGKLLLPKTIYEIVRQGAVDVALVYRNARANAACSKAVVAAYAERFYRELASR